MEGTRPEENRNDNGNACYESKNNFSEQNANSVNYRNDNANGYSTQYAGSVKYCQNCGAPLNLGAAICLRCGSWVAEAKQKSENPVLGLLALIFGILGGLLGLILSAVGLTIYKEEKNRLNCKIGLGFSATEIIISIIIISIVASVAA
ncbi:MAG: hypothetical protein ACI4SK_02685 [Christensenellales bacterium]